MVKRNGLSLVELLIATLLGGVLLYFGVTLLVRQNKTMKGASDNFNLKSNLTSVSGNLQKFMASGDLRFLAFVGNGTADRPVARFLVPQYGRCGDLNATNCPDDSAFLYAHYDKLTTPTLSAICSYDSTGPDFEWLVDLNNPTYGLATSLTDGFDVPATGSGAFVAGKVSVVTNSVLALMNPPFATLWVANQAPVQLMVTQNLAGAFSSPLPADCIKNLQVASAGPPVLYKLDKLFRVVYRPFTLTQFTGGAQSNVTDAEVASSQGSYPLRFFSTTIRSLGKRQRPDGTFDFAISPCRLSGTTVICDGDPISTIPKVSRVSMEEVYSVKLNPSTAERFQFGSTTSTPSSSCGTPLCTTLPIENNAGIKVLRTATENVEALDSTGFSFIKQEVISKFAVKLTIGEKDEAFDIIFP